MLQKGYDLLGLAQRAGQVQSGDAATEAIIKKGKAKLVLLSIDASEKTKEHFIKLAEFKKVRWVEAGEKLHFGYALGKSPRTVLVVTDDGFANIISQQLGEPGKDF